MWQKNDLRPVRSEAVGGAGEHHLHQSIYGWTTIKPTGYSLVNSASTTFGSDLTF